MHRIIFFAMNAVADGRTGGFVKKRTKQYPPLTTGPDENRNASAGKEALPKRLLLPRIL